MISVVKPGSPAEVLASLEHHGVKGMKWGVRKDEEPIQKTNINERTKIYIASLRKEKSSPQTAAERKQNIKGNEKKFDEKFGLSSDKEDHRLTPNQKKLLIGAGVVVGVAAIAGTAYYLNKSGKLPGQRVGLSQYQELIEGSKSRVWSGRGLSGEYMQESSFLRPGFELPAGHTFHRVSTVAESGFDFQGTVGTYATSSVQDMNRYLATSSELGYANSRNLHHTTFNSMTSIKVPSLTEALETMREVMAAEKGVPINQISEEHVMNSYRSLSGGPWNSPRGKVFVKALSGKGFGAIVDEMDAGVVSDRPLLVFNGSHLTSKSSQPFKKRDILKGINTLTEISGRK